MPSIRLAALWLAVLATVGCQPSDPGTGHQEKVYRHAIDGAPTSLDPAHADNVYAATLVKNLFDTLYRYKYLERPYELTPNLAEGFPEVSDDGRVYRIRLRANARFADDTAFPGSHGRRVTAQDVVYSMKRHFMAETRSRGAWLWRDRIAGLEDGVEISDPQEPVAGLRAIDDRTVRIELTEAFPQFPHTLAMALSAVVPHEAVEHYGESFGVNPVGSGPFTLQRFDESLAVLEPNPNFDRGTINLDEEGYDADRHAEYGLETIDGQPYPLLDRLEIHFITEPTARWSSFASSRGVDAVMVPPEMADRVLEQRQPLSLRPSIRERYHSLTGLEAGFVFHGFNMANPAIGYNDDPQRERRNHKLRCAMRDAFDWTAKNRAFYHGLGAVFPGVIPPLLDSHDPEAARESIRYRPERAMERLESAGWHDESLPQLNYGLEASVQQRQMFEQFRAWMQAVGFPDGSFRPRSFASFGEYARAIGRGELDIFLLGWTLAYPDAQYALQLFYGPNAAPGANSMNYANPEFDRLFERASSMAPGPERTRIYRRLNQMVIDDCVIIGSLARTRLHLWRRHVRMLPDREMVGGFFLRFVDVAVER
ncbi:ABC transporter substrate-binding protein [Wenzhouxiangella sp. EGI_FJ10305]|uniref:ABC transporter substrate-binding protein n=1 Tax=Wenzhouxiangella sp. EGI_FJ10305 TaxID=3243768 RepID=UPI0035DD5DA0